MSIANWPANVKEACTTFRWFNEGFSLLYSNVARMNDANKVNWRQEFSVSMGNLDECRTLGGRYWIVRSELPPNSSFFYEWSVCAPSECSVMRVKKLLEPVLKDTWNIFVPEPKIAHSSFLELASWYDAKVSWAILGVGSDQGYGGTSSLAYNLHQHPGLELLYTKETEDKNYEEHFFMYQRQRYLPLLDEIKEFNSFRTKWGNHGSESQPLRGIKRGSYMWSEEALTRLMYVKGLRIIIILTDPVEVFDRVYMRCLSVLLKKARGRLTRYASLSPTARFADCKIDGESLAPSWVSIGRYAQHLRDLSGRLLDIVHTFGSGNFFVAHKELLNSGRGYWDSIAAFLGVAPFPSDMLFRKVHANATTLHDPLLQRRVFQALRTDLPACDEYNYIRAEFAKQVDEFLRPLVSKIISGLVHNSPSSEMPPWLRDGEHKKQAFCL